jgi:polynucleotide 5'-kinase involved in rRNA processing
MLSLLVGASRLGRAARSQTVDAIVYDTSGLVDPAQGGLALKQAVIDLLQPSVVFGIQRAGELEPLLVSLRRSSGVRVIDLCPAPQTRRRDVAARQAHRAEQFARYFSSSGGGKAGHTLMVDWSRLAVYPAPRFVLHSLLALEDRDGYALGLGIVFDADLQEKRVEVHTPLDSLVGVDALRLGDLIVDPRTFRDRALPAKHSGGSA